jgi:hypothetical protein
MLSSMSWMRSSGERLAIWKTRVASASTCFHISGREPFVVAGIIIDEKIDVAFRTGPVARCRTEQIKRRGAQCLDGARLISKFPECFGPGHGASVS